MVIVNEIFHSFVLGVYDTCNPNSVHGVFKTFDVMHFWYKTENANIELC